LKEARFVIVQNLINHLKNNYGYFCVTPRTLGSQNTVYLYFNYSALKG